MQAETRDFLNIIKSAIFSRKEEVAENIVSKATLDVVKTHNVTTLFCKGIDLCNISVPDSEKDRMLTLFTAEMMWDEKQRSILSEIRKCFLENGISFMPLKGSVLKGLYPATAMRVMGDIDILIKVKEYEKIRSILKEQGFEEGKETSHEFIWTKDGVVLELHKNLMPEYDEDLSAYFGNGWQRAVKKEQSEYCFCENDMFIYLFSHFAKHYRSGGAGVIHLVDLYLYMKKNKIDNEYVRKELSSYGLGEFYENILKTIEVWFGSGQESEITELVTETVMMGGKFGDYSEFLLSAALRNKERVGSYKAGRIRGIVKSMFPDLETMKLYYGILKKLPVLLPFLWIWRLFSIVLLDRKRVKRKLYDITSVSDENVEKYEEALKKVGIRHNMP